jgi:hypothetical protein
MRELMVLMQVMNWKLRHLTGWWKPKVGSVLVLAKNDFIIYIRDCSTGKISKAIRQNISMAVKFFSQFMNISRMGTSFIFIFGRLG